MKTLILMRHAKAQQLSADLTDKHRPLAPEGIHDAKKTAKKLLKHNLNVDELIVSPSTRTIETAHIIKEVMDDHIKSWSVQDRLYASDLKTLLHVVCEASKKSETVMLIGHNPELDEMAEYFLQEPCHLKTGEILLFKFNADSWQEVKNLKPSKVLRHDD